jgi:hypothetical protein
MFFSSSDAKMSNLEAEKAPVHREGSIPGSRNQENRARQESRPPGATNRADRMLYFLARHGASWPDTRKAVTDR